MTGVSASPSWAMTSLQWLEVHMPAYVAHVRTPDVRVRLKKSLVMMSFEKVQSELADEDDRAYDKRLDERVAVWDEELHRQMREFLKEGGYTAERRRCLPDVDKAASKSRKKKVTAKKEAVPVPAEEGTGDVVVSNPRRAGKATALESARELDEIVEQELLARDARLGAW
jgi:hypothetical protein